MTSGVSLNVSDLSPEVRQAAQAAARRAGMSLDAWLRTAILDSTDDATLAPRPQPETRPARQTPTSPTPGSIGARLDDLSQRLEKMTHRPAEAPAPKATPPSETP